MAAPWAELAAGALRHALAKDNRLARSAVCRLGPATVREGMGEQPQPQERPSEEERSEEDDAETRWGKEEEEGSQGSRRICDDRKSAKRKKRSTREATAASQPSSFLPGSDPVLAMAEVRRNVMACTAPAPSPCSSLPPPSVASSVHPPYAHNRVPSCPCGLAPAALPLRPCPCGLAPAVWRRYWLRSGRRRRC